MAEVGDPVPSCQPRDELERPDPLARVQRVGQFLVDDRDVHWLSLTVAGTMEFVALDGEEHVLPAIGDLLARSIAWSRGRSNLGK